MPERFQSPSHRSSSSRKGLLFQSFAANRWLRSSGSRNPSKPERTIITSAVNTSWLPKLFYTKKRAWHKSPCASYDTSSWRSPNIVAGGGSSGTDAHLTGCAINQTPEEVPTPEIMNPNRLCVGMDTTGQLKRFCVTSAMCDCSRRNRTVH